MTKEQWLERYAARVNECAGWSQEEAMRAAEAGAEVFASNERAAGNALEWEDPEDEADEEMSCWTNDDAGAGD